MSINSDLNRAAVLMTMFVFPATMVSAQQSDWSYDATVYLFMPETETSLDTSLGNVEGTLNFSDAFSNLDLAFMGAIRASNGRWSFLADYNYTDLSFNNGAVGTANSSLDTSVTTQFLSGYIGYRVYEAPAIELDVAGGFRWFSTETEFTIAPGTAPDQTVTADNNWTDPVVAVRARYVFSDKWSGTGFLDYGGFRSGSETWQVLLTADYAINDKWLLRAGYRHIAFDHEINGNDFEFNQSGPLIGAAYRF